MILSSVKVEGPTALSDTIRALEQQRANILASIAAIGSLRSGLVREIRTKCGAPRSTNASVGSG